MKPKIMARLWVQALLAATFATGPALAAEGAAKPGVSAEAKRMEICAVCAVREGSTHPEDVVAERTYEGRTYAFCNQNCAAEFDTDPAAYARPVLPRPAPWAGMALVDLAGQPLNSARFAGEITLVDFWATWCVPCRKSMPELQALHARYADRGFSVLGISIDEPGAAGEKKVRKFVAEKKIKYPIAIDAAESPVWERFRVKAVPAAFLVDREGRIVAQWTGAAPEMKELEGRVAALLDSIQVK